MPDKYTLHYFNGTALGEPIRYLLAFGKFDWEDVRYKCDLGQDKGFLVIDIDERWPEVKQQAPFGQLPFLEINGKAYAQCTAISRYLGSLVGLSGRDALENLAIDMAVDTFHDLRLRIVSWAYDFNLESKAAKKGPLMTEQIPFYMKKLEQLVKDNDGYVANGRLSWGDLLFAAPFKYLNVLVGFDLLEPYPTLKQLVQEVEAIPHIAEYLAKRPATTF